MLEGRFELREVDWTPARVAAVGLVLVTAVANFAITTTTGQLRFAVLALGLLVCFVLFFTDLWHPRLYLVGAGYVVLMAAVWYLSGEPMAMIGLPDKAVQAALIVVFVYLLAVERRNVDAEEA